MPRPRKPVPSYRLHKQSGQAVVTVSKNGNRRDYLLGKYDSPESKKEYERIIAELRTTAGPTALAAPVVGGTPDITVAEMLVPFLDHVDEHYRHPDGTPTSEVYNFKLSLRSLLKLYGDTPAREFGPKALKSVRNAMIENGWCRIQINARVGRIRRAFKWAASEELIPVSVFQGLTTVTGLQAGRSKAHDRAPVKPAPAEHVESVLPQLNRHIRGLVEFQRFTGCRPGEACRLRRCDLDTSGTVWLYRPSGHKTQWRGKARVVPVGPKAQELIRGFFTDDPAAYLFNPRLAVAECHAARSAARKTPRYPSHMKRNTEKRVKPDAHLPQANRRYNIDGYNQAIARACDRAGVPVWTTNQLRHLFATEVRRTYGLEAAQCVLGHEKADVTQLYAERNLTLAAKVAAEIG